MSSTRATVAYSESRSSTKTKPHSISGKTSEDTDTFQERFVELIPYERIVEVIVFESQKPRFAGEMRMIVSFADVDGGTEVAVLCEDIQEGIRPEDNETCCKESLQKQPRSLNNAKIQNTSLPKRLQSAIGALIPAQCGG